MEGSAIQDNVSYDEYSGYWSYEGKTHEQILSGGGIELSCTITGNNQFSGTLFSQQEITQRFASIEDISGKIEQAELYFDYSDDEWGNSGTLHIQFLSDSIYVEVLNDKEPMLVIHLAKNEIYARHGYIFANEDLYNYFMGCIWYDPACNSADFNDSVFNEYEKANLEILSNLDVW